MDKDQLRIKLGNVLANLVTEVCEVQMVMIKQIARDGCVSPSTITAMTMAQVRAVDRVLELLEQK